MNDLQHICFSYILSLVLTEAIVIKGSRRALNICAMIYNSKTGIGVLNADFDFKLKLEF